MHGFDCSFYHQYVILPKLCAMLIQHCLFLGHQLVDFGQAVSDIGSVLCDLDSQCVPGSALCDLKPSRPDLEPLVSYWPMLDDILFQSCGVLAQLFQIFPRALLPIEAQPMKRQGRAVPGSEWRNS